MIPPQQCKHVSQNGKRTRRSDPPQQCKHVSQIISTPATVIPPQQCKHASLSSFSLWMMSFVLFLLLLLSYFFACLHVSVFRVCVCVCCLLLYLCVCACLCVWACMKVFQLYPDFTFNNPQNTHGKNYSFVALMVSGSMFGMS